MEELREIQAEELRQVAAEAVGYFQREIERKGLVFTDALRSEFSYFVSTNSTAIAIDIHFLAYGRYKDMKILHWTDAPPPIDNILEWVKKKGVGAFAWVPGYENTGKVPAESIAIKRLARAIQYSFVEKVSARKYDGTWYNATKMRMINVARLRIMGITAEYLAKMSVKELMN